MEKFVYSSFQNNNTTVKNKQTPIATSIQQLTNKIVYQSDTKLKSIPSKNQLNTNAQNNLKQTEQQFSQNQQLPQEKVIKENQVEDSDQTELADSFSDNIQEILPQKDRIVNNRQNANQEVIQFKRHTLDQQKFPPSNNTQQLNMIQNVNSQQYQSSNQILNQSKSHTTLLQPQTSTNFNFQQQQQQLNQNQQNFYPSFLQQQQAINFSNSKQSDKTSNYRVRQEASGGRQQQNYHQKARSQERLQIILEDHAQLILSKETQRLDKGMLQSRKKSCSIDDGPQCFGLAKHSFNLGDIEDRIAYQDMYAQEHHDLGKITTEIKLKSKDSIGILLAEEAYTFALTFKAYNNVTEGPYQILVDRVLEAEFTPQKVIYIEFVTPVFLSQIQDEELVNETDIIDQKDALASYYPNGTFAYNQMHPVIIRFKKPVQLKQFFVKQHRAPSYYLKRSFGQYEFQASFQGKTLIKTQTILYNYIWKKMMPSEGIVIDELIIPAGVDFDSIVVHVDNLHQFYLEKQTYQSVNLFLNQIKQYHQQLLKEQAYIT